MFAVQTRRASSNNGMDIEQIVCAGTPSVETILQSSVWTPCRVSRRSSSYSLDLQNRTRVPLTFVNIDWNNFVSALAGGAIGGFAAIYAQTLNAKDQRKREQRAEETTVRGFVRSIADELDSVWSRYNVEIGPHLRSLEDGKPAIPFPLHQSYFAVFDTNASLLGRIPDEELGKQIISTYVEAKGFVDSMRYYERLVIKYKADRKTPSLTVISDSEAYTEIVDYSAQLKKAHAMLETKIKALQQPLRAYLEPKAKPKKIVDLDR
jgi:hypothetical protein